MGRVNNATPIDKIEEGNSSVEVIDTGSNGQVVVTTDGTARAKFRTDGHFVVGGSNLDTAPGVELTDDGAGEFTSYVRIDRNIAASESALLIQTENNAGRCFEVATSGTTRIGGTLPGSPNITLNANGNLDIANGGNYGANGGVSLGRLGILNAYRATTTASAEVLTLDSNVGGSKDRKITFTADGGASFSSNQLKIENGGSLLFDGSALTAYTIRDGGVTKTELNKDGSAAFAGAVRVGANAGSAASNTSGVYNNTDGSLILYKSSTTSSKFIQATKHQGSGSSFDPIFSIDDDAVIKLADGGGINFHNYGTGATVDSNLLNDYEEGTFTPVITSGVTSPVNDADTRGTYTKVGNLVSFSLRLKTSSGTNNSSTVRLGGLPFGVAPVAQANTGGAYFTFTSGLVDSSNNLPVLSVNVNDRLEMYNTDGSPWIGTEGNGIEGRTLTITGQYFTDD